jgi:hypothetical protein
MSSTVDSGFVGSIAKSKKLGLVFTFAGTCLGLIPTTTNLVFQIALLSASALAVISYVLGQSYLEAKIGQPVEEEELPALQATVAPTTQTLAAK